MLDPSWTVNNRVRAYSPIFTPDYRNVLVQSSRLPNVFFTGNYRTFQSITSTGTALGAGLDTAEAIDRRGAAQRGEARGFVFGRCLGRGSLSVQLTTGV